MTLVSGGVEDAGRRVGDDVGGDDRVLGVRRIAAVGGRLDGGVDLLDGGLAAGLEGEVGGRAGRDRHAQRVAVELALELGQHQADRLGGTGRGRDDVERGGAGAAQVLVRASCRFWSCGVGVDRGHQALDDAELVVEHLGHRRQAVGRARGVGDDVVAGRVVVARG